MAEVTAMRNNVLPYPIYGCPYVVVFPFLDADGDLVTGATSPDAEISKNGDTFADCTNESVEIATTSGMYYLILTSTEMQCNIAAIIAKSTTSGLKTTPIVLEPQKLALVRSGTSQTGAAGSITLDASASAVDDFYNGMACIATIDGNIEIRMISDYVGSTKVASVEPNWNVTPDVDDTFQIRVPHGHQMLCHVGSLADNTVTATSIVADAFTAAKFAADVSTEFATTLLGTAVPGAFGAGTLGRVIGRSCPDVTAGAANGLVIAGTNAAITVTGALTTTFTGNLTGSVNAVTTTVGSVTGNVGGNVAGSVGSVGANGITAASLAADAEAALADAVWDEVLAGHLGAGSTGAALNAAGGAGDPWLTALPGAYGVGTAGYRIGTNLDAAINDIVTAVNAMPASILATGGSEPAIAPEHTAGIGDKIDYLYATLKNEWTLNRDTGRYTLKTEGGAGTIAIYDAVSNATTFTKGEIP